MTIRENKLHVLIDRLKDMGLPLQLSIELQLCIHIPKDIGLCCTIARIIHEWELPQSREKAGTDLLEELCVLHFS